MPREHEAKPKAIYDLAKEILSIMGLEAQVEDHHPRHGQPGCVIQAKHHWPWHGQPQSAAKDMCHQLGDSSTKIASQDDPYHATLVGWLSFGRVWRT